MSCNQNRIDIISVSECLKLNLSIPEYQRPYKWSVQSIDDMLWDINNSVQQSFSYSNYKYRIGTIILHKTDDVLNVVDGQQRLISLTLISKYLDHDYDNAILRNTFYDKITQKHIHDNYIHIKEWFSLRDKDIKESFKKAFLDILELVVIQVGRESEAFQLFDSQNTRGRALDPHDLLKAFHLREMQNDKYEMEYAVTKWEAKDVYPVSASSTGSSNNLIAYNGSISLNTNSNKTNISSNEDLSTLQSVSKKINLTMDAGDFDLSSYLFPYNYMYPDNNGNGAWLISLLKKDGTWELVYRQSAGSFNIPLQTSMSEWNISSNHEQYARTCDGYLRCRITRYKQLYDNLYQRPYYDIANYYYVLDYLPQQVKMSYTPENQVLQTRIMSSSNDEYTQDIKIFIKDTEGTNRVIVEQLDEGNDLPIKYEVTDFKKGYFVATVDKELFTEFVVYSYNNNGSTVSETLVVDPLVPYDFSIHLSSDKIVVNGNTRSGSRLFDYNIYTSSTTTLQHVKKGVISTTNPVIQISDLSKGAYILDVRSGNKQKSVKFVK